MQAYRGTRVCAALITGNNRVRFIYSSGEINLTRLLQDERQPAQGVQVHCESRRIQAQNIGRFPNEP
jgi:hypothetical protein